MSLSIIVASSGRETLQRTIDSARSQMKVGDEILVSVNSDCPWGHAARNQLMRATRGDWLLFMDDDDTYTPGALDAIRADLDGTEDNPMVHVFRMQYPDGRRLWQEPTVRCGNVSTQMVAVPAVAPLLEGCKWGDRYEGDFDFIHACASRLGAAWHEHVIALVRP